MANVTPGLTRGPATFSHQHIEHILPLGIALLNQLELPLAPPALEALLMFDTACDVIATLRPDEAAQTVTCAKV